MGRRLRGGDQYRGFRHREAAMRAALWHFILWAFVNPLTIAMIVAMIYGIGSYRFLSKGPRR